jgi:hypothetical protein
MLRDQRVDRRDRPSVGQRDPASRQAVAVRADARLSRRRDRPLAEAIDAELTRGLELREQGANDKRTYACTTSSESRVTSAARRFARVDFEEHTIYYCPECQTGGRVLKDRPTVTIAALMSALLEALVPGQNERVAELLAEEPELDVFEAAAARQRADACASCWRRIRPWRTAFGDDGFQPLGLACFFGTADAPGSARSTAPTSNMLSRNEHDPDRGDSTPPAPRRVSTRRLRYELVKLALEHGADPNLPQAVSSVRSTQPGRTVTRGRAVAGRARRRDLVEA